MTSKASRISTDEYDYDYDLIVVGSGIGGLTVASLVAQMEHKRVLVLDRHFKIGGLTHTFKRHKFEWDTGIHYVGSMNEGKTSRRFMDLITGGQVSWRQMADPYDLFIYPDLEFEVPTGLGNYQARLIERFPDSAKEIRRYFKALKLAANWGERTFAAKIFPRQIGPVLLAYGRKLGTSTTAQVLEKYISDPTLRGLLATQWGDYGLPPSVSAFTQHAMVTKDYFDGGFYPAEGGADIASAVVAVVEAEGGTFLTSPYGNPVRHRERTHHPGVGRTPGAGGQLHRPPGGVGHRRPRHLQRSHSGRPSDARTPAPGTDGRAGHGGHTQRRAQGRSPHRRIRREQLLDLRHPRP